MADPSSFDRQFVDSAVESFIRIALIAILAAWCYEIVRPFAIPAVWGVIIAVALFPGYRRFAEALGGRRVTAAVLVSLLVLAALAIPAALLSGSMVQGAHDLAMAFDEGSLEIPPPPDWVGGLPLVGPWLQGIWSDAATDLESALVPVAPQIKTALRWLVGLAAGAGLGMLQFVFAIVIAGILLAQSESGRRAAQALARRLVGERGAELTDLAEATVRSVTRGILGVALIQSTLAGLGWLAVGIPGAGLWTLLALLLSTVQIGIFPITLPTLVYVFFHADTVTFVVFAIWTWFVSSIDNVLKPILLGRGVKVPMAVVFIGAIGGLLSAGITGLFVGAVVLVLGYKLLVAWVDELESRAPAPTGGPDGGA
jgi:predicted PurR-regulated permease PerM